MKKKLLAFMTATALTVSLFAMTGCGSSAESSSESSVGSSSESSTEAESSKTESSSTEESSKEESSSSESSASEDGELLSGIHHAEINVKDYGTIKVELDADTAPITVTNFVKLADSGFYDDLTFHRVISGFMIQGGDPNGNGTGGSDETIKGEFSDNGVENNISHVRGVISMARATDYDSASSQFFIVHADATYLDGQYAAFGHVTDGMEIVDNICNDTPIQDSNGSVASEDQPVIESIIVTD